MALHSICRQRRAYSCLGLELRVRVKVRVKVRVPIGLGLGLGLGLGQPVDFHRLTGFNEEERPDDSLPSDSVTLLACVVNGLVI